MTKYSESQKKAIYNYRQKIETFQLSIPKGKKAVIREHAAAQGETMNSFVLRAIDETMQNDNSRNDSDKKQPIIV